MATFFSRLVIKCRVNFGNLALTNVIWKDCWSFIQCGSKRSWFSTSIRSKAGTSPLAPVSYPGPQGPTLSWRDVVQNDGKLLGISYLKDGNDGVLQPEEEYPDWLWQLNKHKQTMETFEPHSRTYRRLLRKTQRREENERRKMKRF